MQYNQTPIDSSRISPGGGIKERFEHEGLEYPAGIRTKLR